MPPKKKTPIPKALKIAVWNKHVGEDKGKIKCLCCKITEITQLKFHCGHIIAESMGGTLNVDNLLPICESCNKSMGTKNLNEFKKMLNSEKKEKKKKCEKGESIQIINKTKKQNAEFEQLRLKAKEIMLDVCKCSSIDKALNQKHKENLILNETYDIFYLSKKNSVLGNEYCHKKCNEIINCGGVKNTGSRTQSLIYNYNDHFDCLLGDDDYINFLKGRGYLF